MKNFHKTYVLTFISGLLFSMPVAAQNAPANGPAAKPANPPVPQAPANAAASSTPAALFEENEMSLGKTLTRVVETYASLADATADAAAAATDPAEKKRLMVQSERYASRSEASAQMHVSVVAKERLYSNFATAIIAVFGLVIMISIILPWFRRQTWENFSYRLFGLTLIIFAALLMLMSGAAQERTAPLIGLLGTALGYVLGKENPNNPVVPGSTGTDPSKTPGQTPATPPVPQQLKSNA